MRVLDIGCGGGRHVCAATRFPGIMAVGVDYSFDNMVQTRQSVKIETQYGLTKGKSIFLSGDITRLPFSSNFFDLVICSEVLEHIPSCHQAVNEIIRVAKPGKSIVVSVPRFFPEKVCWALSQKYHQVSGGHIRIFRKKELIQLFELKGVKKWASHFAHSLHTPYWWLKCLVGPDREDSVLVNLYHRFLVWDIMKQPQITFILDRLLNPIIGKSVVVYFQKTKTFAHSMEN